jgi:SnoaL-like protein
LLAGVLLLALLVWGVERLVVTDREAIEHLLERTAAAVERDDWDGVAGAFADDFRSQPTKQDKRGFLARAKSAWTTFGRPALRVRVREATIDGDAAACSVRVTAAGFTAPIDARIELVRGDDGWRISRLVEHSMGSFAR